MSLETYITFVLPLIMLGIGGATLLVGLIGRAVHRRRSVRREAVIDAVRKLQPTGTSFLISVEVDRRLSRCLPALSCIFTDLYALEREGVISSGWGARDPKRGNRRPRYYWISDPPSSATLPSTTEAAR